MNEEVKDDPRQVLAILNSLGIVNVTAQELKVFLKVLKLYRKLKQTKYKKWYEEIIIKTLKDDYIKNIQPNTNESNIFNIIINHKNKKLSNNHSEASENKYETDVKNTECHEVEKNTFSTTTNNKKNFKSFKSKCQEFKVMSCNKKMNNDPVTLYNVYKDVWKQLSIPGETTHTKLRWAIRKKIFGSNCISRV